MQIQFSTATRDVASLLASGYLMESTPPPDPPPPIDPPDNQGGGNLSGGDLGEGDPDEAEQGSSS